MSWYAMTVKWWADEDVEAASPWAWPLILDAIKAGGGVASERALADVRLIRAAGLTGVVEDAGRSILDRFIAVGLVVEADGGYTARSWSDYQRDDDAKRERQKRWREKKRGDVSETSRDVAGDADETSLRRRGDVSETATVQYSTQHNSTQHDVLTEVVGTTPRMREDVPLTPSAAADVARVAEAFRRTQSGRQGMHLAPATVTVLGELVVATSADVVVEAIRRAAERCKGELTIAYLRPVVAAVAKGDSEGRPRGVAQKAHASAGIWDEHGASIPIPKPIEMDENRV